MARLIEACHSDFILPRMVAAGQGKKRFFEVREKSGNLTFHYIAGQFFQ